MMLFVCGVLLIISSLFAHLGSHLLKSKVYWLIDHLYLLSFLFSSPESNPKTSEKLAKMAFVSKFLGLALIKCVVVKKIKVRGSICIFVYRCSIFCNWYEILLMMLFVCGVLLIISSLFAHLGSHLLKSKVYWLIDHLYLLSFLFSSPESNPKTSEKLAKMAFVSKFLGLALIKCVAVKKIKVRGSICVT